LLFATAATGLLIEDKSRDERYKKSSVGAMLFGATTAIFLGYYPVALLFGTFLAYQLVVLLAFASSWHYFLPALPARYFRQGNGKAVHLCNCTKWRQLPLEGAKEVGPARR